MTKHFVTFLIPMKLFTEEHTEEVSSCSPDAALELLRSPRLKRLAGVTYGFYFTTKDELDSHTSAKSDCYFLGGTIETQAQIRARQDPAGGILLRNMETNNWDRVITVNTYAGKVTLPMQSKDVNLPYDRPPYDTKLTEIKQHYGDINVECNNLAGDVDDAADVIPVLTGPPKHRRCIRYGVTTLRCNYVTV